MAEWTRIHVDVAALQHWSRDWTPTAMFLVPFQASTISCRTLRRVAVSEPIATMVFDRTRR